MIKSVAEHVKDIYRMTASDYDQLIAERRMGQFLVLIRELQLRGDERILDVGCGPGVSTLELAKLLPKGEVIGVDITERMLELARQRAEAHRLKNIKFLREDAMSLSFPDGSFDVVFSSYLLPWVPQVDQAISEMQRVLKVGGKIGIITAAPGCYDLFYKAIAALIERYQDYYGKISAEELIGAKRFKAFELQEKFLKMGLSPVKLLYVSFEEFTTPELYVKKMNSVTAELYLKPLPQQMREEARAYLLERLAQLGGGELLASERSIMLIGKKNIAREVIEDGI